MSLLASSLILSTAQPLSSRYAPLSINYVNYLLVIINETVREQYLLILITNIDYVFISQKVKVQGQLSDDCEQELRQFARHVVHKFLETLRSNDKAAMELFFWKSVKDAVEVTDGYGSYR